MGIKLIMCDMDGTLLNDDKVLDSEFIKLIKPLNDMGVMAGVASGRQYQSIIRKFDDTHKKMVFIVDNGAAIYVNNKLLDYRSLDRSVIEEIISISKRDSKLTCILCGNHGAYHKSDNKKVLDEVREYYNSITRYDNLDEVFNHDEIIKVTIFDEDYNVKEKIDNFIHLREKINVVKSGFEWIDFNALGTNKGSAIRRLKEIYHLSDDNCMAFGDFNNDIEMLKEVKYSIAMANANEDVKKICNYSCLSNNENGVSKKIKEFFEID